MTDIDPLKPMLKIALNTARSQRTYFSKLAVDSKVPEVKSLLLKLASTEAEMVRKILHMMVTGIVDEIEELEDAPDGDAVPDPTPFDSTRAETDPRIFICNNVLEKSIKTYTLYLRLATKAKSEVVSRLFEYLAYTEKCQIDELRQICAQF